MENRVQEIRKKRGYTQEDLSKLSGISMATIQKIESKKGSTQDFSVTTAVALARALNVKVEKLFKRKKIDIRLETINKESKVENMENLNYENLIIIDAENCNEDDIKSIEGKSFSTFDSSYILMTKQMYEDLKLNVGYVTLYNFLVVENEGKEIEIDVNYSDTITFNMWQTTSLIKNIITNEDEVNNILKSDNWYNYIMTEIKKLMFSKWLDNVKKQLIEN